METLLLPDIACHSGRQTVGHQRGIQLNFALIEPVVFLQGHSIGSSACKDKAAIVRGSLHMKVTEPVEMKQICIYFRGLVKLELSEGLSDVITSGITYFDRGQTTQPGNVYGADICHILDRSGTDTESGQHSRTTTEASWRDRSLPKCNIGGLQQPGLLGPVTKSALFPAGDYLYNFEFLLHNSLPETINTELISTRYYLEAQIEPSGPFSSKVVCQVDVPLTEPIVFSRKWREQLYYDVCIFGKCFPHGSQIPMRVKLTPLVNLQCHWIRVYVSQHVRHQTKGQTTRFLQLPTKRVLLFEKQPGLASYTSYPGSTMRIMTGPPGIQSMNLLGEEFETSEINLEVQLPRCQETRTKGKGQWLHFSTKGGSPEVNHWIQIVLCLSIKDQDGMGSSKPRPVELTIESPFTILSCKATPANIYVPPYEVEGDIELAASHEGQCGCGHSPRSISPASRHEAEARQTEARDNLTSLEGQLPKDITQPLRFDSISSFIKQPARAHLPDWALASDELHRRPDPYRSRQWYGG
ncbi:arrestin C-terminal domain-containing protein [Aspergillus fischeri NRRL 181]|uniref:Arrestin C-terminal-like domain-containing protein n=1 Tax=Neosartorya fischeri (strain ATCC 1020 / DSM 3700 / CBS 544.65 / FGSC A1164 / JCM 1740 / NRRL 181 / WB 181) TaxID=331117 RepID=A1DAI8_NEOFI|nr:uncharacterized protein NFIA_094980 [Aspergillus fischeri NRRL 181]EAW19878.1 hypothetical protein NFIA_094980 [Aspergillus fischeri NRRL 181]